MSGGLLINGSTVPLQGLHIIPPASVGGPAYAALGTDDRTARPTSWVRQIIIHTTKGQWPQHEIAGAGPGGSAKVVSDFWRGDPAHSAAHLVVDTNGDVVCLCDLATTEAYHAEGCNPWSIGIEMYQLGDGGIYQATLEATCRLVCALTMSGQSGAGLFPIPAQIPRGAYPNRPLRRMESGTGQTRKQLGGEHMPGVFGHRDNTERRGRGDPGDSIFARLLAAGFEPLDFDSSEDLARGADRQRAINAHDDASGYAGARLVCDGVFGPASAAAMRRQGFARWRDVA